MVRTLLLIRHAAAGDASKDFDRPLTREGQRDALHLGQWVFQHHSETDHIVTSTALRAEITAETLAEQLKISGVEKEKELYEASVRTMLKVINQLDNAYKKVIIVGHNPTISYLSDHLTDRPIAGMQPGSAVVIEFENLDWNEVSQSSGQFKNYYYPGS